VTSRVPKPALNHQPVVSDTWSESPTRRCLHRCFDVDRRPIQRTATRARANQPVWRARGRRARLYEPVAAPPWAINGAGTHLPAPRRVTIVTYEKRTKRSCHLVVWLAVDGAPPSVPPGAIPRSSRDGPARTRRACSEMASSVARGGLPAAVCCARTCARGWCGGAGVPRLPPAAPSSLARAMDLPGRGGPAPRWRAWSLEADLLRLRAAHLRTHVRKHARTWVVVCGLGGGAGCRMHSGGGA
jgi:hypothetical protein